GSGAGGEGGGGRQGMPLRVGLGAKLGSLGSEQGRRVDERNILGSRDQRQGGKCTVRRGLGQVVVQQHHVDVPRLRRRDDRVDGLPVWGLSYACIGAGRFGLVLPQSLRSRQPLPAVRLDVRGRPHAHLLPQFL